MQPKRSITETPNPLSGDIDLATPLGIVRILRQADAQIFGGYLDYPGLFDDETLWTLSDLARRAAQTIRNPRGRVVLSGAGTSGRLAMFAARVFNELLECRPTEEKFRYLIAGGDAALIQAQEGAEDDPHQAIADLESVSAGADEVFFVGITCGFSAPYIAGQLEASMDKAGHFAVLLGFNPVELARNIHIEGWPRTFLDTARRVAAASNAALLNPVIGPEPVTGSTRMKSGTATKILLETLFHAAIRLASGELREDRLAAALLDMLRAYEQATRSLYLRAASLARLVEAGGHTLRAGGHIFYLGTAGVDAQGQRVDGMRTGLLGLIDASECPPTYGADFEDVRGFLVGGWRALFPQGGSDLSDRGGHYRISLADFVREKQPNLTANDLCVFIGQVPGAEAIREAAARAGSRVASVVWNGSQPADDIVITLDSPAADPGGQSLLETQIKLTANALTTGAHILAGKVFGNRMIDLRISNNKLFHRTVGIIADLMHVSHEEAVQALLRAIFETDELSDAQREAPISACIERAKRVSKVVPKALLLATGQYDLAGAEAALRRNPIVRSLLAEHLG
jgi:N-acetylmuramic acid 6-phosphate (MurNAc-6-P) etherase